MTLTTILGSSALIIAAAALGTQLLPRTVHVERQAVVDASVEEIIALAASNSGYQAFNPYKDSDPDLKITTFGPDAGVGSGFHFEGKEGKGSQTVAEVTANSVRYDIDLGPMGKPTQMLHAVEVENGVLVTWSMDADMGVNPIGRVIGLFMDRMVGGTFEAGLTKLNAAT